jgi:integrase
MGNKTRIGVKVVEALPPNSTVWDATVTGFGARRQSGPAVAYIVSYRTAEGRSRMQTIGRHGAPWTPDTARAEARRILGEVARGDDPAAAKAERRAAPTVNELCNLYLTEAAAGRLLTRRGIAKKPATLETDRSRIDCHIRPLLGGLKVRAVTAGDVEKAMHDIAAGKTHKRTKLGRPRAVSNVRAGKGGATRTIGLLGALFTFAVKRGMRADNPVHGVTRYADGKRERRLSPDEYRALGAALRSMETITPGEGGKPATAELWPPAAACIRFLALTGWRRGEALNLRWREVDLVTRTARLTDTKTGASLRPLARRACDVLAALPRRRPDDLVFQPSRGDTVMSGLPRYLARVMEKAKIEGVSAHTLRHSFASMAADGGASELTIAALIGHKSGSITSRYVHHADPVLLAAADRVADSIAAAMGEAAPASEIVAFPGAAR